MYLELGLWVTQGNRVVVGWVSVWIQTSQLDLDKQTPAPCYSPPSQCIVGKHQTQGFCLALIVRTEMIWRGWKEYWITAVCSLLVIKKWINCELQVVSIMGQLKRPHSSHFQVHICILYSPLLACLHAFMFKKRKKMPSGGNKGIICRPFTCTEIHMTHDKGKIPQSIIWPI